MKSLLLATLMMASTVNAATVAIIDSGVDTEHTALVGNIWMNPNEIDDARDDDGNGYQDDIYGWNFAEQNNMVIDRSYLGTFSQDVYTLFEVQERQLLGQMTQEDRDWIEARRNDPKFMAEAQKFGNFVHGTHVAGIAVRGTQSKALAVKLIPTEIKPFMEGLKKKALKANKGIRETLLKSALEALAKQQMNMLVEIALYVKGHNADVANGSFGTGFAQAKMITDNAFRVIYFRKPTEQESNDTAKIFMNALITEGKRMLDAAPNTLFVFAAGNDGTDNDTFPTSPTNIKADNSISVAATYQDQYLAPFSNFGKTMVDIAAPGMLINSTIPGNEFLTVSGTSQAAPYIAHVAAMVKEANPALTPVEIKRIMMGTVDARTYLADKVVSGGLVNSSRAVVAGKLSQTLSIVQAIAQAKARVADEGEKSQKSAPAVVIPMALPSMFR